MRALVAQTYAQQSLLDSSAVRVTPVILLASVRGQFYPSLHQ